MSKEDSPDARGAWANSREFWKLYAHAFALPFHGDDLLSRFVTSQAVTGAYAEAWVRSTVRSMLGHRFRISTGAVIRPADAMRGLNRIPQCDLIVWDPSEMPAIFESGGFALVPLFAVRAIIEVERRLNKKRLERQLRDRLNLLPNPNSDRVLGVVISHGQPLFHEACRPDYLTGRTAVDPPTTRILGAHNKPDTDGIMAFIYFLAQVAGHSG